jgi:hypothetical protein
MRNNLNGGTKHMMLLGAVIGFIHNVVVLSIMSLPVEGRYILSELCVRKGRISHLALVTSD